MYQCHICSKYYCMNCKESTACPGCENKTCSDCDPCQCLKCKKGFCFDCSIMCERCVSYMCHECDEDNNLLQECANDGCDAFNATCNDCASENTCQKCKRAFCGCDSSALCRTCNKRFCWDCVTFRRCNEIVPGCSDRCRAYHCVDCQSFLEVARTCPELNKAPCQVCSRLMNIRRACVRCYRTSCETWQAEKKKLMDDQLNVSNVSGGAGS